MKQTGKTFGTLSFDQGAQGQWIIVADPHVVLRAKRVFSQIARQYTSQLVLSDTIDVCRDLEWFCERFPLEMDGKVRWRLQHGARKHRERESLVENLVRGITKGRAFELAIPARDYQKAAAELALHTKGLLLADDVGIGKTCSAICMLTEPATRPALVVTQTHLTRQWQSELRKFAPKLSTHVIQRGTPYDLHGARADRYNDRQLPLPGTFPDVLITTYTKLSGWAETLSPIVRSLIFDEVQELRRGEQSQKGQAAAALAANAVYRIGLSATPIYNYGSEIHNVLDVLSPNALGTRTEFLIEWCGQTDARGRSRLRDATAFGSYLRDSGLMLRRTRAEVQRELPDLTRVPYEIDVDERPLREIRGAAVELARIIVEKQEEARGERFRAAEEFNNLVRHATGVAKAPYVASFVRLLVESGESVVLYGWHRDVYRIWQERLGDLCPVFYTGTESPKQKDKARDAFVKGRTRLLIMSLRSGAGLDGLQESCRTVVFGELDWSPGVHEQCAGRIHRDGQKDPVTAYYLLADSGSDPIVADVLQIKRAQIEGIRNPGRELFERLDRSGSQVRALAEQYLSETRRPAGGGVYSLSEKRSEQ